MSESNVRSGFGFGMGCMLAIAVVVLAPVVVFCGGIAGIGAVGNSLDEEFREIGGEVGR